MLNIITSAQFKSTFLSTLLTEALIAEDPSLSPDYPADSLTKFLKCAWPIARRRYLPVA